ncbi:hypothetical protein ACTXT7_009384 [Hymenolepis weldensis]
MAKKDTAIEEEAPREAVIIRRKSRLIVSRPKSSDYLSKPRVDRQHSQVRSSIKLNTQNAKKRGKAILTLLSEYKSGPGDHQ